MPVQPISPSAAMSRFFLAQVSVAVLLFSAALAAQVPLLKFSAPQAGPHGWQVTVTNTYTAAATAYWINLFGEGPPNGLPLAKHWADAVPGPPVDRLSIPAGQSRLLSFGNRRWQDVAYKNVAVIYADGATAGDSVAITRFERIRAAEAADLQSALAILAQAQANGTPRKVLAQAFEARATAHAAALRDAQGHVTDRVCKTAASNLERADQSRADAFQGLRVVFTRWLDQLQASKPALAE